MSLPRIPRPSPIFQARLLAVVVLVLLAGACGDSSTDDDGGGTGPDSSGMHTLTGGISIEGAFELSHTPASRIVVQPEDISLQDVSSVLIAEEVYEGVTTLPLTYELMWIGELHPQRDYTVGARVYDEGGQLIFVTDTVFPVFQGDAKVDFHIVSVHGS
ncbi:MAG: YbaY family lipoprotein [Candidatus Tectomicrobia bacterium]|nr:YbaY family lipoprotein [Candidatus Tectomicrobia bacterium]